MHNALTKKLININIIDSKHIDELHRLAALYSVVFELKLQSIDPLFEFMIIISQQGNFMLERVQRKIVGIGGKGLKDITEFAKDIAYYRRLVSSQLDE